MLPLIFLAYPHTNSVTFGLYEGKPQKHTNSGMRKKTLDELRATARERQRRWREENQRTHRERVKEVYGIAKAQKLFADGVTPQEARRYGIKEEGFDIGIVDLPAKGQNPLLGEIHYAPEPGVDTGYEENRPPAVGPARMEPKPEAVSTSEESRVQAQLERFKRKRAAMEIEVEM